MPGKAYTEYLRNKAMRKRVDLRIARAKVRALMAERDYVLAREDYEMQCADTREADEATA